MDATQGITWCTLPDVACASATSTAVACAITAAVAAAAMLTVEKADDVAVATLIAQTDQD
jgi:hypothetical protein